MPNSQALANPARLAALHKTGLLETAEEERFDGFTRLAAQILGVPTVIITLVESKRQYFKSVASSIGALAQGWNPLDTTFCQDVVAKGAELVVPDTEKEPLSDGRHIRARAYLGVPLLNDEKQVLGALCAMDYEPRPWSSGIAVRERLASTSCISPSPAGLGSGSLFLVYQFFYNLPINVIYS